MSNQNSGVLFLTGLMIGGLVGASLALLLAPQSGAETRGQIRAKSLELKDEAMEGLAEAGHHAQAQVDAWQENGQAVFEKRKRNTTEVISLGKDSISQAVGQSKDRVVEAIGSSE